MTTTDLQYALRKMGFVDYGKCTLRNGDCKVMINNDYFLITDGITSLPTLSISYISRVVMDTLANMLILQYGQREYGFIL